MPTTTSQVKTNTRFLLSAMVWPAALALVLVLSPAPAQDNADPRPQQHVRWTLTRWAAIGPFGHGELPRLGRNLAAGKAVRRDVAALLTRDNLHTPDRVIDLDADAYTGPATTDAAGRRRRLTWTVVDTDDGFARCPGQGELPHGLGVGYFSAWVHAPRPVTVTASFPAYGLGRHALEKSGATVELWVNGRAAATCKRHADNPWIYHPIEGQRLKLQAGWNHVYARVVSLWAGIKMGLELGGPPAVVAGLRQSPRPPEDVGRRFSPAGEPRPAQPQTPADEDGQNP